jgi:uncharacterized cupredoxin-like copper-binding protein
MKIKPLLLFVTLSAIVLLLAACGGGETQTGAKEFTISVKDEFSFDPDNLTVKAGEEVKITFENTGSVAHSFNILKADADLEHIMEEEPDEEHLHEELIFDIHEVVSEASSSETFAAPSEPGEYTIFCSVPGHAQAGMVGTLKVTQ